MITLLIMITVLVITTRRNVSYGLVIIWALYGIILKGQETGQTGVMETAWMGTGVVSLTCLTQLIRNFVYENTLNQEVPDYVDEEPAPVTVNTSESV